MIKAPLFATLTGLHLALLQFSYFFLLLINVTSTYITYMTIVISWMAGTLIGLWLRLSAGLALVLGVVSYYAVYLLVISDPLSPSILPIAALGVAVTGLWAGRFFVLMLPLFGRPDSLFFHENNGFMVGVVAVFIGFTLLGKPFLLWTPLVSVLVLLGGTLLLRRVPPVTATATAADAVATVPPVEEGEGVAAHASPRLLHDWQSGFTEAARVVLLFAIVMILLNLLIPPGIALYARAIGEHYWTLFWGEDNLITWFSSVQLLLIGMVAWLNREVAVLAQRLGGEGEGRIRAWIWWIFMLGFFFLSLDERFRIHEQVRDQILKPDGLFVGLEYLRPGDVGLYFYLAVGLFFTGFLLAELRRYPWSLAFFVAALLLTLSVAVVDSLPERLMEGWSWRRFMTSAFEEVGENTAQLLFLLSFTTVLHGRLRRLGAP